MQPRYFRIPVLLKEHVEILHVVFPLRLREHRAQLAVLDVPLEQLRREGLLELVDVRLDARCVRVLVRWVDGVFVAEGGEAAEVAVLFGECEGFVDESVSS